MLVSSVRKNSEYCFIGLQVKNKFLNFDEREGISDTPKGQDVMNEKIINGKEKLENGLLPSEYCESLLGDSGDDNSANQNTVRNNILKNVEMPESGDGRENGDEIKLLSRKTALELEWLSDEENRCSRMFDKKEISSIANNKSLPTRFSPETNRTVTYLNGDYYSPDSSSEFENTSDSEFTDENLSKSNSSSIPTTSKNKCMMQIPTDEETNFDIFEYDMCPEQEVADCVKLFNEKDELTMNGDLVNIYEKNLGLDVIKDKNVCWAAGNFDNEVCPLRSYEANSESNLWNFSRDNLDLESRDSFSQGWTFGENIEQVPQEQVSDPQIILPKKTVDITKIKGWRRKQFTLEKCLRNNNSVLKEVRVKSTDFKKPNPEVDDENRDSSCRDQCDEQNKDYAFVCDKLDDFLDQEAELKISYEIPHLYAEYGIKLTSEDIVSRPKFTLSNEKQFMLNGSDEDVTLPKSTGLPTVRSIKSEPKCKSSAGRSLLKKPDQKGNSALPDKSHKNKTHCKENNSTKSKPVSILKKEFAIKKENSPSAPAVPCRRSNRIMRYSTANKTNTSATENRTRSPEREVKIEEETVKSKVWTPSNSQYKNSLNFPGYSLIVKKLGMILYPRPFAPLNPYIRFHLQKIRSCETFIDKNWANFAASAVLRKGEPVKWQRMVLPLICCFKYKNEIQQRIKEKADEKPDVLDAIKTEFKIEAEVCEAVENLVKRVCDNIDREMDIIARRKANFTSKDEGHWKSSQKSELPVAKQTDVSDLKEEAPEFKSETKDDISLDCDSEFLIEEIKSDSDECRIIFESKRSKPLIRNNSNNVPIVVDLDAEEESEKFPSNMVLSADLNQITFNKVITNLLAQKLNELKSTQSITNSIDILKTFKVNVLELIKLNFIKENFQLGYINLWYVKCKDTNKLRVFLTFSMNSPMEEAINLKMTSRFSPLDLPNIIRDIITKDKLFDSNDFAILYCDGKQWEIHGSVNFTMDKNEIDPSSDEKIQVFHLVGKVLPELELLREIKQAEESNQNLKWWVMHMMQDYTEIIIRLGNETGRVTRSVILQTWKSKVPSFIAFKGLKIVRPVGIAINPRLWPYFLIGPYYLGDHHGLSLKMNSKIVPFEYYPPLDRIESDFLLKRFVSSVIMHSWRNNRQVVGMWLYDRIGMKQSNFIEVRTKMKKLGVFEPIVEHDYSLSRKPDGLFKVKLIPENKQVVDKSKGRGAQKIYLVPNIPNLGYIKGILHPDRSVTIEHPLKPGGKIRSSRIGDWLNKMMKRRIRFIPKELDLKWSIVKNAAQLSNHKPLDRFSLGGTHILCKKGAFYILSLTKDKIRKLGLDESVVKEAIVNNRLVQEVVILKQLGKIILEKDRCDLKMGDVLQMALAEIEKLEKQNRDLIQERIETKKEREMLCRKYIKALKTCDMDENTKRTIHFYVSRILKSQKVRKGKYVDKTESETFQCLEAISKFLLHTLDKSTEDPQTSSVPDAAEAQGQNESSDYLRSHDIKEESQNEGLKSHLNSETVRKLETKIKKLYDILKKSNSDDTRLQDELKKRLILMSEHLKKIKNEDSNVSVNKGDLLNDPSNVESSRMEHSSDSSKTVEKSKTFGKRNVEDILSSPAISEGNEQDSDSYLAGINDLTIVKEINFNDTDNKKTKREVCENRTLLKKNMAINKLTETPSTSNTEETCTSSLLCEKGAKEHETDEIMIIEESSFCARYLQSPYGTENSNAKFEDVVCKMSEEKDAVDSCSEREIILAEQTALSSGPLKIIEASEIKNKLSQTLHHSSGLPKSDRFPGQMPQGKLVQRGETIKKGKHILIIKKRKGRGNDGQTDFLKKLKTS